MLRVHPAPLRRAHGAEMLQAFTDRCRHAMARGGAFSLSEAWLHELRDLLCVAFRERTRQAPTGRPSASLDPAAQTMETRYVDNEPCA